MITATPFYNHNGITIYCGDCLEIMPQIEGPFGACITDPPYGLNRDKWDKPIDIGGFIKQVKRLTGEFLSIFGQMPTLANWHNAAFQNGLSMLEHIVWVKRNSMPGGNSNRLKRGHESIYIYTLNGNRIFYEIKGPYEDVKLPGLLYGLHTIEAVDRYIKDLRLKNTRGYGSIIPNSKQQSMPYKDLRGGREISPENHNYTNVWSFLPPSLKKRDGTRNHPTEKPVELMARLIGMLTNETSIILDPFMGSGTTLVAAQNEGRQAVGIDTSEAYCKMAVSRLRQKKLFCLPQMTGNGAVNGKQLALDLKSEA